MIMMPKNAASPSRKPGVMAGGEVIRMARVALSKGEFAEWVAGLRHPIARENARLEDSMPLHCEFLPRETAR